MERRQYCYKKDDKQNLKNNCPVSLLPICGNIFETLIFNQMFSFFPANNLLPPNQSDFKPGDSRINQLVSNEIYHLWMMDLLLLLMKFIHLLMMDLNSFLGYI